MGEVIVLLLMLKYNKGFESTNNARVRARKVTHSGPENFTPSRDANQLASKVIPLRVRMPLPCLYSDWLPFFSQPGQ